MSLSFPNNFWPSDNDPPEKREKLVEQRLKAATDIAALAKSTAQLARITGRLVRVMERDDVVSPHVDLRQTAAQYRQYKAFLESMSQKLLFAGAALLFPAMLLDWHVYVRESGVQALYSEAGMDKFYRQLRRMLYEVNRTHAKLLGAWDN